MECVSCKQQFGDTCSAGKTEPTLDGYDCVCSACSVGFHANASNNKHCVSCETPQPAIPGCARFGMPLPGENSQCTCPACIETHRGWKNFHLSENFKFWCLGGKFLFKNLNFLKE